MGDSSANSPEIESTPDAEALLVPTLDVDLATVSVVDGIWHDQPDNVAAFVEARLGDLARGRGNLYICLDVSGEVEGRSDIERALIEVIRDTYATSRGSISFALSEALRAANAHLYESNRQVARELRRMAGVSAVVLRGSDLYIAQSGPGVVYVEANEKLARFPAESDWFVEDAPLIAPQGTASPPLGMRREFASDLAHASVSAGDVFVLATRALTQLATTEELAIAFTERSAQEIAGHLEELGEDADITALVAELMNPHTAVVVDETEGDEQLADEPTIESLPVPLSSLVSLDESEPPVEEPIQDEPYAPGVETGWQAARPSAVDAEPELDWDADEEEADADDGELEPEYPEPASEPPPAPQPVYAAAAAALPMMRAPAFRASDAPPLYDEEIARRRAERAARRAAQKEGIARALGAVTGGFLLAIAALGGAISNAFGGIDWDGIGKQINRALNLAVSAIIGFFLLLVRLVLPGANTGSTKIVPRRATSDPVWLKAFAVVLPILFVALALGRFMLEVGNQNTRIEAMVAQADSIVKQAEINPDKTAARAQLTQALEIINQARAQRDTQKAREVLYRIQDQLNEIDGVAVLYFLPTLAQLNGAQLQQIVAGDQDIFLLDGSHRVHEYTVNDASGAAKPAVGDGTVLKPGDKVGDVSVEGAQLIAGITRADNKAALVAVGKNALYLYDPEAAQWSNSQVEDAETWGEIRSLAGYGGNLYLLDAANNQIHKYVPSEKGLSAQSTPYFAGDAQPVLNKAVDMAIDGDIWVLNDNGTILRFRGGAPVSFSLGPLATPLKNPVAIFTQPEVDSLYVADAGNQRIVEFDKNGVFVRQFKPYAQKGDVFQDLSDFTVNETKRKLYFISGDAAYMANVPK